ncbi:uncharacterized protein LOC143837686 isoform X2 [Paroedura picta]|uniref:uncharacterized protein LOC143837686 isoform X2 n=1 Tax=Paroedura picta TaxID=143630 RepID=UPI004055EB44
MQWILLTVGRQSVHKLSEAAFLPHSVFRAQVSSEAILQLKHEIQMSFCSREGSQQMGLQGDLPLEPVSCEEGGNGCCYAWMFFAPLFRKVWKILNSSTAEPHGHSEVG